ERPGERDELALAERKPRPALLELRLVPVLEPHDELVRPDRLGGGADLGVRRLAPAESDVLAKSSREQEALLGDDAELAAERGLRDVANVGPVDRYPAVCRVVKAGEQLRDRGLAGARVADQSDGRAGGDVEIDPVEDLVAAAVPEPDMLEADMALDPRQVACSLGVAHLRLLVEHGHDLVQRGR